MNMTHPLNGNSSSPIRLLSGQFTGRFRPGKSDEPKPMFDQWRGVGLGANRVQRSAVNTGSDHAGARYIFRVTLVNLTTQNDKRPSQSRQCPTVCPITSNSG